MNKRQLIATLRKKGIVRHSRSLSLLKRREIEEIEKAVESGAPDHLSHTQVDMYRRCGLQYFFSYKRGIKNPPGINLTLGKSVEAGIDYNYLEKIETGQDEPLDVLEDVYHEDFEARREDTDWKEDDPDKAEKVGRGLIGVFRDDLAPRTYPVAVQKEYNVEFGNVPYTFKAFIDLIAGTPSDIPGTFNPLIIDHKTAARSPNQGTVDVMDQLTAYAGCYQMVDGDILPVGIDAMVKTKVPKAVQLRSTRTEEAIKRYWKTVQLIYEGISAGYYPPAQTTTGAQANWVCSPKFCGYWDTCHEEF